jgi:hypothetical protein
MRRVHVGRQLRIVRQTDEEVYLEGALRLQPGHSIEIVFSAGGNPPLARTAAVESWSIARLGSEGPWYAGACRWE